MTKPPSGRHLWIRQVAATLRYGHDSVLVCPADQPERGWTGGELARRIGGAAALLDTAGCPRGTVVPALLTTRPESMALVVAGAATGRPLAPLSPRLTVAELADCLADLESPVLLCEPESVDAGLDDLPANDDVPALSAAGDAKAFVLHTSGTSGRPRRVDVRQDRLGARAVVNSRLTRLSVDSVYSASSPFHHVGGLGAFAVALATGAKIVTCPRFTVDA